MPTTSDASLRPSGPQSPVPALLRVPESARASAPAAFFAVVLVTVAIVAARPDLSGAQLGVIGGYGLVTAVLAAVIAAASARRRAALHAQDAKTVATALDRVSHLRTIIESLHEGLIFQDAELRIVDFNDAAATILGLSDMALGRLPEELGPWRPILEDGTELSFEDHPAAVALRTGTPVVGMTMGVALQSSNVIWCRLNVVPVVDDQQRVEGVITTFTDLTDERSARHALESSEAAATEATEALSWQTFHDPLTQLPNRAQLVERLSSVLARGNRLTAVFVLDLDRFKNVNDTMGHEVGDVVLMQMAERLRQAIRSTDMVARLAGDEFIVLAESLTSRSEAVQLARRLRAVVSAPITLPQGRLTITACVGIAFDVDHRPDTMLRDADTALHTAKEQGRDRCEVFDDSLRAEMLRRVSAEQLLRHALDDDGLRVLYQPIVDLQTGDVVAAEALLRILGPHGELLTPASFITIAEDTGLIVPVGAGVLDDACRQLTQWRTDLGDAAPRTVAVNLSARQITTKGFPELVKRTLALHGLEPSALSLELTETTLIEAGHIVLDTVEALHELGVRLAIDDFGTGYSSLSYLKRFPVDIVKVDRSFVSGLGSHQHDTEIVKAVLALGSSLGLETVAEGVETLEQLELLRDMGCHRAQGYLFARPGDASDLHRASERIRPLVHGGDSGGHTSRNDEAPHRSLDLALD